MNADDSDIAALVRQTVSDALRLPPREARTLLNGLLLLGGEHPGLDPVREAYLNLSRCEQQLELIALNK